MRAIDPVVFTTSDGQERKFLLSMGGVRRLKTRLGVAKLSEFLQQDAEAAGVPILYEALLDKGGLTEEQFADLLPAHIADVVSVIVALFGISMPDPKPKPAADPTIPAPAIQ